MLPWRPHLRDERDSLAQILSSDVGDVDAVDANDALRLSEAQQSSDQRALAHFRLTDDADLSQHAINNDR